MSILVVVSQQQQHLPGCVSVVGNVRTFLHKLQTAIFSSESHLEFSRIMVLEFDDPCQDIRISHPSLLPLEILLSGQVF